MKTITLLTNSTMAALLILAATTTTEAGQVVVFGDSWGVPFAPALQYALDGNGYSNVTVVGGAFNGETASNMASNSPSRGLPYITNMLNANPDAELVHVSIGGNDLLGNWSPTFTPAQDDTLLDSIYSDISTIVNHILSVRPDIQIYHPTYDYFPASTYALLPGVTTARINSLAINGASKAQALADSIPQLTFHNSLGLMQVQYGLPSLGIPAFDASLPDPAYPSPEAAFSDAIHLTVAGYVLFAQEAFDVYYEAQLVPEPTTLTLATLTLLAIGCHRRRRV